MRGTFKISSAMYMFISYIICIIINLARAQDEIIFSNLLGNEDIPMKKFEADFIENKNDTHADTVDIKVYYECLCPGCIKFDTVQLNKVVDQLSPYLNIHTYPYGNAKTVEQDGKVKFKCQHGPKECYGNKLHACALNHIANHTKAIKFNICMMDPESGGSDDPKAIKCGNEMGISVKPILQCAKGEQGTQLLKYYGEESKKINFKYVPYILINGVQWNADDFMKDVCAVFKNQPEPCKQL